MKGGVYWGPDCADPSPPRALFVSSVVVVKANCPVASGGRQDIVPARENVERGRIGTTGGRKEGEDGD